MDNTPFQTAGLDNRDGVSCYMNSIIQSFCHNVVFVRYIIDNEKYIIETIKKNAPKFIKLNINVNKQIEQFKEICEHLFSEDYDYCTLTEDEITFIMNQSIVFNLIKIIKYLWNSNSDISVFPMTFTFVFKLLRNGFFANGEQHDVEEAINAIFERIEIELLTNQKIQFIDDGKDELTKNSQSEIVKFYGKNGSIITDIITSFTCSELLCSQCNFISSSIEPQIMYPIEMVGNTLYDCIEHFCKKECLINDNKWECTTCKVKVNTTKEIKFWSLPPILTFQMKRFSYTRGKNNTFINFPLDNLDMSAYIHSQNADNTNYVYKLQSVINHIGNMQNGHYFTYCYDIFSDKWHKYDDEKTSEINENRVVSLSAYILTYIRKDLISNNSIDENDLISENLIDENDLISNNSIDENDLISNNSTDDLR
jgi:ubiquitin C-terminal hydrolase